MPIDYTNTTVTGYNTSPPVDDGTVSEANRTRWQTIKEKLADPLKTAIGSIDTQAETSFGAIPLLVGTQTMWISATEMVGSTLQDIGSSPNIEYRNLTDSSTDPVANGYFVFPNKWDVGSFKVIVYLIKTASGSGAVKIDVSAASVGSDDAFNTSSGGEATEIISVPGSTNDIFRTEELEITASNTPASGDLIRVQVERDYADGGDSYADTIGVFGLKVIYSTTAVNDD